MSTKTMAARIKTFLGFKAGLETDKDPIDRRSSQGFLAGIEFVKTNPSEQAVREAYRAIDIDAEFDQTPEGIAFADGFERALRMVDFDRQYFGLRARRLPPRTKPYRSPDQGINSFFFAKWGADGGVANAVTRVFAALADARKALKEAREETKSWQLATGYGRGLPEENPAALEKTLEELVARPTQLYLERVGGERDALIQKLEHVRSELKAGQATATILSEIETALAAPRSPTVRNPGRRSKGNADGVQTVEETTVEPAAAMGMGMR